MKRATPEFPQIPDKVYFRIGEVSHLVGVDTHVLRYWESEFTLIRPFRGPSKQRLYRRQDVENLLRIKGLLHDEGYTISGAKKHLKHLERELPTESGTPSHHFRQPSHDQLLATVKQELREILSQLDSAKKNDS